MVSTLNLYNLMSFGNAYSGGLQANVRGLTGLNCGNIFTNCFGEVNYNAIAGYNVANALMEVASQAIASNIKAKEPAVNYKKELENICNSIQEKEIEKAEQTDIINKQIETINTAESTKKTLEGELNNLESDSEKKKSAFEAAAKQTPVPDNLSALETLYKGAKEAVEAKKEEITKQEELIEKAEAKKEAAETKEAKLQEEIDQLKKQQEKYKDKINEQILDNADGNVLQRARKKCMSETYNEQNPASKADIRKAFNTFINAKENSEKRTSAEKIQEMYLSNPDLKKDFSSAYNIIQEWLKENPTD